MEELKDDRLTISDGTKEYTVKILFTAEHAGRSVVFFMDPDGAQAECAYYDDKHDLDPLSEDDWKWAEETFAQWQKDQEEPDEES